MRTVEKKDLVGKTIVAFDHSSVNLLKLMFSDGTTLELWAEQAVTTSAGSIPGIFVDSTKTGG